jgi:hypothetical protein
MVFSDGWAGEIGAGSGDASRGVTISLNVGV